MPQLGETVAEGTIIAWYKAPGDSISPGDVLFEIETDKTSMEIPATAPGVLARICALAGSTVPVGAVVAVVADGPAARAPAAVVDRTVRAPAKPARDPFTAVQTPERNFGPATLPTGVKVTPIARRLAAQLGVRPEDVAGTGPSGRIVAKDVEAAFRAFAPTAAATATPLATLTGPQVMAMFAGAAFEEIPLSGMRRTIARRLSQAVQTIPHFYLNADVAVDRLTAERARINAQAAGLFKLSLNDLLIKALAVALQRVPDANAVWAEDRILRFHHADIAVAVAVEGGMYTPVIRRAESKPLIAISREMSLLAQRARTHALTPAEYQGGAMTVSNLGMYGVRAFSAIVNPPQAAILAVGAVERRPAEAPDGSVRFGAYMSLTLSCDHRVIDGALAAQLLAALKNLLEAPQLLFA